MAGSVNKCDLPDMYASGMSLPEIEYVTGIPRSTVRHQVIRAGVEMRSKSEALAKKVGLGDHSRGKPRPPFSEQWKKNISEGKLRASAETAKGVTIKPSGYVEFTTGENKGRSEHVIAMERRLGRHILPDEVVHHIDGNRSNNSENNLALVTRSGHARLHRREERIAKGAN